MNGTFVRRVADPHVRHDMRIMGDFVGMWCAAKHAGRTRRAASTEGVELGLYGPEAPTVCDECATHLAYAERRRAYCPRDPKPYCAHCETQCYAPEEREWQREMMRFAGPRAWMRGHLLDAVRHMMGPVRARYTHTVAKARDAEPPPTASAVPVGGPERREP